MSYKIEKLNLSNNSNAEQGFVDIKGNETLQNVEFKYTFHNIENGNLSVGILFESDNLIKGGRMLNERVFFYPTTKKTITESEAIAIVLNEPEFKKLI